MGTSNENKRNRDEEGEMIIPWSFVTYSVRRELIKKLNPDVTMSGNDWRMLASELGYTTGDINYIESEKDNNTSVLFKEYDTKPGASLNCVYRSLEKMQRQDCLDIIRNALPDIQQAYNKANESQILQASKTPELLAPKGQFQFVGSPCAFPYGYHSASACGSHACYQCSHTLANIGAACASHHPGSYPNHYHVHQSHSHHSLCQPFIHSDTIQKTCEFSLPSSHHANSSVHDCIVKAHPGCIGSAGPPLGGCSPSTSTKHSPPGSQIFGPRGHSDLPLGYSSYRGSPTDTPYQNVNNMPLPNNISVVDNSNLSSSGSSSDSSNSRQMVARQYSNECNMTQASNEEKRIRHNMVREKLAAGDFIHQHNAALQGSIHQTVNRKNPSPKCVRPSNSSDYVDSRGRYSHQDGEMKVRNSPGVFVHKESSCVSDQAASSQTNTSLALLKMLADVPDKFKPTNEYKTVVAEQKVDKRSRDGRITISSSPTHSSKGACIERKHPSTLPVVEEIKTEQNMNKNLTISKKLTPVPSVNKPLDDRKAFYHIEVFVTYSYDNESHGKQVLSLCKFLQSNGFSCSVDVCEKKSVAKSLDQLEWCRRKVLEADFVLVCISQKYLEDISSGSNLCISQTNERHLHTREIYELMNSEYLNSQNICGVNSNSQTQRFVPLLFPKMTPKHVPPCMINTVAYSWPEQYKDLAWMLTKPKDRIIGRQRMRDERLEERERNGSDLDVAGGMDMSNLMSSVLCSS